MTEDRHHDSAVTRSSAASSAAEERAHREFVREALEDAGRPRRTEDSWWYRMLRWFGDWVRWF